MRALGVLLVLVLAIGVVGWFRGWFGVQTTHAAERDRVDVVVDEGKVADDARAAADKIGEITGRAADAVKRLAHRIAGGERQLEGTVVQTNVATHVLRVRADGEDVDVTVPGDVAIVAADASLPLTSLQPGERVRITILDRDDRLVVTRVQRL
jgi:hypothetical protein